MMLHDLSRSISANPVDTVLWESVTWVLHLPDGLPAGWEVLAAEPNSHVQERAAQAAEVALLSDP